MKLPLFLLLALGATGASAVVPVDNSTASFLTLGVPASWAVELAPRVPLFAEIWENDPDAILAGDAVRDYLAELRLRAADGPGPLRATPFLDSRTFFPGVGRVVTVFSHRALQLPPGTFLGHKLEVLSPDKRAQWRSGPEWTGVDRLELARTGFGNTTPAATAFLAAKAASCEPEIQNGKALPSVVGALRCLDLLARWGRIRPTAETTLAEHLAATAEEREPLGKIVAAATAEAKALGVHDRTAWHGAVLDAIREGLEARTDRPLFEALLDAVKGGDLLTALDMEDFRRHWFLPRPESFGQSYGRAAEGTLTPFSKALPTKKLYLVAREDRPWRAVNYGGVLEREGGPGGSGLSVYASEEAASKIAKRDRIVQMELAENTRFLDLASGPGKAALAKYLKRNRQAKRSDFIDVVAPDVLRSAPSPAPLILFTENVVVSRAPLVPHPTAADLYVRAGQVLRISQWNELVAALRAGDFAQREMLAILRHAPAPETKQWLKDILAAVAPAWGDQPKELITPKDTGEVIAPLVGIHDWFDRRIVAWILPDIANDPNRKAELTPLLDALVAQVPELYVKEYLLKKGADAALAWEVLKAPRKLVLLKLLHPGTGSAERHRLAGVVIALAAGDADRDVRLTTAVVDQLFLSDHGLDSPLPPLERGFLRDMLRLAADSDPVVRRSGLQQVLYRSQVHNRRIDDKKEIELILDRVEDSFKTVRVLAAQFFLAPTPAVSFTALAEFLGSSAGKEWLLRAADPRRMTPFLRKVLFETVRWAKLDSEPALRLEESFGVHRTPASKTIQEIPDEQPAVAAPPPMMPPPAGNR